MRSVRPWRHSRRAGRAHRHWDLVIGHWTLVIPSRRGGVRVRLIERETRGEGGGYEVGGRPTSQRLIAECTARGLGLLWWRDGRPGEILCQVTRNRDVPGPAGAGEES